MKQHRLLDTLNQPWAITEDRLLEIRSIYLTHLRGEKIDIASIEAQLGAPLINDEKRFTVSGRTAIVPIVGVMAKRANLFTQVSGGVSSQLLEQDLRMLMEDDSIDSVLLDVDSPGGTVDGTQSLAQAVRELQAVKPVVAFTDGMIASAAYWVASAAGGIYINDNTTRVGSIGVIATHTDVSEAQEREGVRVTHITSGRYKGIDVMPLTDEGRAEIQAQCDYVYSVFVGDVAQNRGRSVDDVLENAAEGRIFIGEQALSAGLVDGVSTMTQLLERLADQDGTLLNRLGDGEDPGSDNGQRNTDAMASDINSSEDSMDIQTMTLEDLRAARPDLIDALVDEVTITHAVAHDEAVATAVTAERERIRAVSDQNMPGCEDLIQTLMYDGTTTGEQAAVQVLSHIRNEAKARGDAMVKDAPKPLAHAEPPADEEVDFEALVRDAMDQGMSRSQAIRDVAASHPKAHAAYIAKVNRAA